jgi:hypothetical protein
MLTPGSCPSAYNGQSKRRSGKKCAIPYVETGKGLSCVGKACCEALRVFVVTDSGVDLPDCSEPMFGNLGYDSKCPIALALEEPIAGAAFCLSKAPTCILLSGLNDAETADSVGLGDRNGVSRCSA